MWSYLVFVCLLSFVSSREIKKSAAKDSTLGEYDSAHKMVSINYALLEHIQDLLSELSKSHQPESKHEIGLGVKSSSYGYAEPKIFCESSVTTKYYMCKEICKTMSFFSFLTCKSVMFSRYMGGCLSGDIECYGEEGPEPTEGTFAPEITTLGPDTSGTCGVSPDGTLRVIGGVAVNRNDRFPWQVGLSKTSGTGRNYVCSGTVITNKHILTAASCVNNQEIYTIGFGSADEASPDFERRQKDTFIHPNYNSILRDNNIAIIELDRAVDLERNAIMPICMPRNSDDNVRVTAIVTGWGNIDQAGTAVTKLNEARVQIDDCPLGESRYTDNMLCTTVGTPPVDACTGDAGGPLITDTNGNFHQIGIISHGEECGSALHAGSSGVYTKLSKYVDWINQKVAPERTFRQF